VADPTILDYEYSSKEINKLNEQGLTIITQRSLTDLEKRNISLYLVFNLFLVTLKHKTKIHNWYKDTEVKVNFDDCLFLKSANRLYEVSKCPIYLIRTLIRMK